MVFQHQAHMTNLITRAGWEFRIAAYEHRADLSRTPLRDTIDELVDYLLFVDEQPLPAPINGTSGFAEQFCGAGPGRPARPIAAPARSRAAPAALPVQLHDLLGGVWRPAAEVRDAVLPPHVGRPLRARRRRRSTRGSPRADRRAVTEILRETLPGFPQS